ncbi:MAG: TolC family protein [Verrucomicrobia bacterium]|nr:TolC family protein [Verrucomicrobiota bacterium]
MKSNSRQSIPGRRQFAVALLAVLLAVSPARAQEKSTTNATPDISPTASYTLDALVAEALLMNPELRFYDAEITAAKAGHKVAGQFSNPELSGTAGHNRQRFGGLSGEGVAWSVSVLQPFEWPGRIGLRKAIANQDIELAQLGFERFKTALTNLVRSLAFGVLAAQEKSAAVAEVAGRFKALREVLLQRDPAGLTPLLETRIIEATELNAQRRASEAMLLTQAALLELNQLRGASSEARLSIDRTSPVFRPPEGRNTLVALARTNNFELRVRAVELAQQGFRVDLAKNERFPAISVGPGYSDQKAGTEEQRIIGVGISLPLPLWNRNKGGIEAASARQVQAEASLYVTQREVERKVIEAALTYETKLGEMAKWRPDSVEHFREAADVADRHYRLGAVPIATYVELQKQYLDAVEGLLDTKREALEAAQQLELLTGLPEPLVTTRPVATQP